MHQRWDAKYEELLRSVIPGIGPVEPDTDLFAFGLGSLQLVQLLVSLEDHYDIVMSDDEIAFEMFATPAVLWQAVTAAQGQAPGPGPAPGQANQGTTTAAGAQP